MIEDCELLHVSNPAMNSWFSHQATPEVCQAPRPKGGEGPMWISWVLLCDVCVLLFITHKQHISKHLYLTHLHLRRRCIYMCKYRDRQTDRQTDRQIDS